MKKKYQGFLLLSLFSNKHVYSFLKSTANSTSDGTKLLNLSSLFSSLITLSKDLIDNNWQKQSQN
jgi:lipid-A-disaccharide synthase-like uncharacterized protein